MSEALLDVRDVRKAFNGVVALNGVSFTVSRGQILGIIGPNGSGKTTLLNVATGVHRPSGGEILMDGRRVTGLRSHKVAHMGIARTFQQAMAFPALPVAENIRIALDQRPPSRELRLPLADVGAVAAFVRLDGRLDELASSLSFGNLRRLGIGLALATQPTLLMLDEPAAGLNDEETDQLRVLLERCRDEGDMTVVVVDHDMRLMMSACDHLVVLDFGEKVAEGPPAQISTDEHVLRVYLGVPADNAA